jgi:branched-chain amino acid transport system permease protein
MAFLCTLVQNFVESLDILPQLLVNALIAGSIYALASSGLSMTYGLVRILNFAHGHFMMLGAYIFYFLTVDMAGCGQGWLAAPGLGVSGVAAAVLLACFAVVALKIFVEPMLRYSFMLPFVTTLALATILESIVSMLFGVNVKTLAVGVGIQSYEIVLWEDQSIYITPIQIVIISSALILLSIVAFVVHSTPAGRKIRALAEHSHAAEALGVSRARATKLVFVAGALLAGYAGILVGYETNLQPTMGSVYTIKAFAAMILGGLGNIWGTIAGAYILGLMENLSIGLLDIPAGYKDAFAFVIILMVLLFRPRGLFNSDTRAA